MVQIVLSPLGHKYRAADPDPITNTMQGIRIQSCTNLHEGRLRKTKYSQQSLLYRNIKISFHFQKKLTSEEKDVIFIHLSITL